ncbi:MAG: hypothetical protein KDA75_12575 [Planctomycetaceae bacterium]|nr:hypothetical protein [Planctomycetaceae bacterium]
MNGSDAIVRPWMEYWTKVLEQNNEWTTALMAGAAPQLDPAKFRKQWLGALSDSLDAYMRSPGFLDAMRRNSEAMTAMKTTTELAQLEVAHQSGLPHMDDIRGLFDRLETAHEVLLQRFTVIEQRLQSLEEKLDTRLPPGRRS